MMPHKFNRTRIAPTPSGFLHLGNVLSFSVTAFLARKFGAKILLRIDDLDQPRVQPGYTRDIFETLHFLSIPWHEGPLNADDFAENYSQLSRMERYESALDKLAEKGAVFACSCSRRSLLNDGRCGCGTKGIPLDTPNVSWRLATGKRADICIRNIDGTTALADLPPEMEDFVVRKKDGKPAYQLTSVVDDLWFDVDLVVRGEDLRPSTLAQVILAEALEEPGFKGVTFFHHPLLTEISGAKMSKSAGATSIKYLRESGLTPEEIFGRAAGLAGFSHGTGNWEQLGERVYAETIKG